MMNCPYEDRQPTDEGRTLLAIWSITSLVLALGVIAFVIFMIMIFPQGARQPLRDQWSITQGARLAAAEFLRDLSEITSPTLSPNVSRSTGAVICSYPEGEEARSFRVECNVLQDGFR